MTGATFPGWCEEPSDRGPPPARRAIDPVPVGLAIGAVGTSLGVDGERGINFAILVCTGCAAAWLAWRRSRPGDPRGRGLGLAGAALFSLGFAITENEFLRGLDLLAIVVLVALPLLRAAGAALAETRPLPLLHALLDSGLHASGGALALVPARLGRRLPGGGSARRSEILPILAGSAMALLLLALFGSLLRSADAAFDDWLARRLDLDRVAERALVLCAFAYPAIGWLHGVAARPFGERSPFPAPDPLQLRAPTVLIPLAALLALFGAFVVVQAGYLFPDRPPAEEQLAALARRGFFELVVVGGLSLVLLLAADSALRYASRAIRRAFTAGAVLALISIIAMLASAGVRLALYIERFGWTEARFFAAVFLVWTALALLWFAGTALRGAATRFLPGALAAALAIGAALHAVPIEARIVASHLDREPRGEADLGREVDPAYLRTLGVDAIPALVARWERIPDDERRLLGERWATLFDGDRPVAAWTLARARAERARAAIALDAPAE